MMVQDSRRSRIMGAHDIQHGSWDDQENLYYQASQAQAHKTQLLPDWYWLRPYGPLDKTVDCHVKPETVACLNHLRRDRLAM